MRGSVASEQDPTLLLTWGGDFIPEHMRSLWMWKSIWDALKLVGHSQGVRRGPSSLAVEASAPLAAGQRHG